MPPPARKGTQFTRKGDIYVPLPMGYLTHIYNMFVQFIDWGYSVPSSTHNWSMLSQYAGQTAWYGNPVRTPQVFFFSSSFSGVCLFRVRLGWSGVSACGCGWGMHIKHVRVLVFGFRLECIPRIVVLLQNRCSVEVLVEPPNLLSQLFC